MEALQLAAYAFVGLQLLFGLIAGGTALAAKNPAEGARICYQELALEVADPAVCPRDFTAYTMPAAGEHLMVRR